MLDQEGAQQLPAQRTRRVEYQLVLEGGICKDTVTPIPDEAYARHLAAYWKGRTSTSTGQTGRVECREVTPWEVVAP